MHREQLDMIAHLLPAILPRWTVLALVAWLSTLVLAIWAWESTKPKRTPAAPPDTVWVQRAITKTDTVTETVPRTVVRYDTIRIRDTVQAGVPGGFRYLGLIERRPLDITGDTATLTYFYDGRYAQNKYELPTDRWGVGVRGDFTFSRWAQVTTTLGITRHARWGPMDLQARVGVGYSALVTNNSSQVSPVARVGFRIGYNW